MYLALWNWDNFLLSYFLIFEVVKHCRVNLESPDKGQLISKKIVRPRILPKNERMNSFLLVYDVFSFVFLKNPRPEKKLFKIIWPLALS